MNPHNVLNGAWQNLLEVRRWATTNMSNRYSVAEHSWLTAMLVDRFIREATRDKYLFYTRVEVVADMQRTAIQRAMLHDIEECLVGDIPHTSFTANNHNVIALKRQAIDNVALILFQDMDDSLQFGSTRKMAKNGVAGAVVSYADAYSLLIEMRRQTGSVYKYEEVSKDILNWLDALADPVQSSVDAYQGTPVGNFHEGMCRYFADLTKHTREIYFSEQFVQQAPTMLR